MAVCTAVCAGCVSGNGGKGGTEDGSRKTPAEVRFDEYLKDMREVMEEFVDEPVIGPTLTSQEFKEGFDVVYMSEDRSMFSYRCEFVSYTGGAHENTHIDVGTVDVKTGRKLKLEDVVPPSQRAALLSKLDKAVVKKLGGRENLSGKVTLTDNFCLVKNGLMFVFNEYEIAAYCFGSVEVVIPARLKFKKRPSK